MSQSTWDIRLGETLTFILPGDTQGSEAKEITVSLCKKAGRLARLKVEAEKVINIKLTKT